ncbi:MAG TPA: sigma-70 family RNA polymerase sigma factor [Chthoniobacteraceae bacterium]|nr:sigma-70 family RNA polymerase sigma factor [Chthoniobacteraceae bacterium]
MRFPTTRWDELAKASLHGDTEARAALNEFCRRYWQPVNGFIRWKGFDQAEAADLTQEFFLSFLKNRSWRSVDRLRGTFRTFLLGALNHTLQKARLHAARLKRGGGATPLSLDEISDDEGHDTSSPEVSPVDAAQFDRAWAVRVLNGALAEVRQAYALSGKERSYEALKCFLTPRRASTSYEETAASLGMNVGTVKTEIHRLRQAFRAALRREISHTVSAPHEVEEELRHLRAVLSDHSHDFDAHVET